MTTLRKIALTAAAWLVLTVSAAIAIEILFGKPRPGFVQLLALPLLIPVWLAIWKPMTPAVRTAVWVVAGVVVLNATVALMNLNWAYFERPESKVTLPVAEQPIASFPTKSGSISSDCSNPYMTLMKFPGAKPLDVRAADIFKEYAENQLATTEKYECRLIQTTGTVDTIGRAEGGSAYVRFQDEPPLRTMTAEFSRANEKPLLSLKRGNAIAIGCTLSSVSAWSLNLIDCALIEDSKAGVLSATR